MQLLGGHGVRILDEMLCNYVAEKARTLQRVITTNHTYLRSGEPACNPELRRAP